MKYFLDVKLVESIRLIIGGGGHCYACFIYEPVREKSNNLGSDQVRYELGCTVTGDSYRLEILDLESRGIVLSL